MVDGSDCPLPIVVTKENLHEFVGEPKNARRRLWNGPAPPGVVCGLSWSSMGGNLLHVESFYEHGSTKAELRTTGHLKEVMRESTEIAYSVVKKILHKLEPENEFFKKKVHMHFPSGAIPKEGPSAGCAMILSMLSLALKKPVDHNLALTGEVTLTGRVTKIGGLREKLIAANISQMEKVLVPLENKGDVEDMDESLKKGLEIIYVDNASELIREGLDLLSHYKCPFPPFFLIPLPSS